MITNKTKTETNTYEVEFTASEDALKAEKKRVYQKEGKKYNVPGFRKGKAPMNVIERMYGPVFTQDAVEIIYQKAVDEAIAEFDEEVVDANSAEVVSMEGDVVFKAKFIVKPEVTIEGYKGLTVDAVRENGCNAILRGIRSVTDYDKERNLADINRSIAGVETVILVSSPAVQHVSSSLVRELISFGSNADDLMIETFKK